MGFLDKPKIVKDFCYNGRRVVIVFIDYGKPPFRYHNAYIEVTKPEFEKIGDYDLTEEITYGGDLSHINAEDGKLYLGFDTDHFHNWENPKTQTLEYAEESSKKIVDELNKREL